MTGTPTFAKEDFLLAESLQASVRAGLRSEQPADQVQLVLAAWKSSAPSLPMTSRGAPRLSVDRRPLAARSMSSHPPSP